MRRIQSFQLGNGIPARCARAASPSPGCTVSVPSPSVVCSSELLSEGVDSEEDVSSTLLLEDDDASTLEPELVEGDDAS